MTNKCVNCGQEINEMVLLHGIEMLRDCVQWADSRNEELNEKHSAVNLIKEFAKEEELCYCTNPEPEV